MQLRVDAVPQRAGNVQLSTSATSRATAAGTGLASILSRAATDGNFVCFGPQPEAAARVEKRDERADGGSRHGAHRLSNTLRPLAVTQQRGHGENESAAVTGARIDARRRVSRRSVTARR